MADPHPIVRAGVISVVDQQPDMHVISETADDADTLRLAVELDPHLVVVEALMSLDGVGVVAQLREARPDLKMLILTRCEDGRTLHALLRLGVRGYVRKRASIEEFAMALRTVAAGGTFIDPAMAKYVIRSVKRSTQS